MAIDNDLAALVGFACEAVLYGASLASADKTIGLLICSRVLHHPLRRIHPSNAEAFPQPGLSQQAYLYHQYTFVPLLFHPLCTGGLPLL